MATPTIHLANAVSGMKLDFAGIMGQSSITKTLVHVTSAEIVRVEDHHVIVNTGRRQYGEIAVDLDPDLVLEILG